VPRIKISSGDAITQLNNDINGIKGTPASSLPSTPIFETLDEMLARVNDLLANKPINGMSNSFLISKGNRISFVHSFS
jgi:hypothetical protein